MTAVHPGALLKPTFSKPLLRSLPLPAQVAGGRLPGPCVLCSSSTTSGNTRLSASPSLSGRLWASCGLTFMGSGLSGQGECPPAPRCPGPQMPHSRAKVVLGCRRVRGQRRKVGGTQDSAPGVAAVFGQEPWSGAEWPTKVGSLLTPRCMRYTAGRSASEQTWV